MARQMKILKPLLDKFGLEYIVHKKHAAIHRKSDGAKLLTCSGSPSDPHAYKQVIRDLQCYGHIPKGKYY